MGAFPYYFFVFTLIVWAAFIVMVVLSYTRLKIYVFNNYQDLGDAVFPKKELLDASIAKENRLNEYMKEKKYLDFADDNLSVLFSRYYFLSRAYKVAFYFVFISFVMIFWF